MNNKYNILWISYLRWDVDHHKTSRVELLRHMKKRGHKVSLVATYSKDKNYSLPDFDVNLLPIRYVPIVAPAIFNLIMMIYLPIYCIKNKPDFIVTDPFSTFPGYFWKILLNKFFNIKFILDIRSTPIRLMKKRTIPFNLSLNMANNSFDRITILTNGMKNELVNNYNVNPKLISVQNDATSLEHFDYDKNKEESSLIRKELNLVDRFVIFYHGSINIQRGLIDCIKAMIQIKHTHPNIVLFLLGEGNILSEITKLKSKYDLNNVMLHSPVDYSIVPKYIGIADVGIVPLPDFAIWRNQMPNKLLEYLSMKKPVIVSDIQPHLDIINNEQCCIYFKERDISSLIKAIIYAYDNRELLTEHGAIGRSIIKTKYNWHRSAENYEKTLIEIKNV